MGEWREFFFFFGGEIRVIRVIRDRKKRSNFFNSGEKKFAVKKIGDEEKRERESRDGEDEQGAAPEDEKYAALSEMDGEPER